MTVHHEIPTAEDLHRLGAKTENAVSIYIPTTPIPTARRENQLALKTVVDGVTRKLKQHNVDRAVVEGLREQWRQVDQDPDLWAKLSASLAVFLTPTANESYVLPNRLVTSYQVGNAFDIGQLLRSVTYPHEAYAVTVSANEWALWHATAESRAARVTLQGDYPTDAADANNKTSIRGRQHKRRLVGDEGRKVMLDRYALRLADAVKSEFNKRGVGSDVPLFVFATEPLLSMFASQFGAEVIKVAGASDALKPEGIDRSIRDGLDEFYAHQVNLELDGIANETSAGLVAGNVSDIARAAASGMVATLLFNFTADEYGSIDESSGVIRRAPEGSRTFPDGTPAINLLSEIAVLVLAHRGRVLAIRGDEASSPAWNHVAVAHLRHALN